MSPFRPALARALACAAALVAAAAFAPAAHALTPQELFLIDLPAGVTTPVTRDADPEYPAVCPVFNVVVARGTEQAAKQDEALDGKPTWTEGVHRIGPDAPSGIWWRIASELYFPADLPASTPRLTAKSQLLRTDLTYPATNFFNESTPGGTIELLRYLNRMNVHCPSTRFVLLGYSQGAMVIAEALSAPGKRKAWFGGIDQLTTATTNAIAAVGLVANPSFNRSQSVRARSDYDQPALVGGFRDGTWPDSNKGMNDGNFNPAYSGINPRNVTAYPVKALPSPLWPGTSASMYVVNPALDADTGSKVRDFCKSRDYICQAGNWNSSPYYHELYKSENTHRRNLAVFALEKLKPLL